MIEIIEYNNRSQAEALLLRLNNRLSDKNLFKGVTNSWTFIKEHPTQSKFGVVIDRTAPNWDEIEAEITPNEINNIVTMGADWHPQIDI